MTYKFEVGPGESGPRKLPLKKKKKGSEGSIGERRVVRNTWKKGGPKELRRWPPPGFTGKGEGINSEITLLAKAARKGEEWGSKSRRAVGRTKFD